MAHAVNVLIVDPSRRFRDALARELASHDDIAVAGSVANGGLALEFLQRKPCDAVLLDVEMEDVLGVLRTIQERNADTPETARTGVILVAGRVQRDADVTIQALEAGAFDFVTKPLGSDLDQVVGSLGRQLLVKLRHFASKRIFSSLTIPAPVRMQPEPTVLAEPPLLRTSKVRALLVGVSTGGPKALSVLLPAVSELVELPILVVQHMPPNFTASLAGSLDAKCRHRVVEGGEGMAVEKNTVYIAPGGKQMRVFTDASGSGQALSVTDDPPEDGCRPSVNQLFRSGARVWGGSVVAVVLTGMGSDGTKGLLDLKQAGAYVIAQDKSTSVVWGMPGSAVASGCVDKVLPIDQIAAEVAAVARGL